MLWFMGSQRVRHDWATELNYCSMSSFNWCFLTSIQISQEAGHEVWYSHLLKNFPQFVMIHTVKGYGVVNKAKVDFFWNSLVFPMIQRMLAIWSLVPLPFLNPAETSGSSWFMNCWSLSSRTVVKFWAFLYYHVRWVQLCGSLSILWHCLSLGLEWKLTFSSPVATAEFSRFAGILTGAHSQHHVLGFKIAQLEFHYLH